MRAMGKTERSWGRIAPRVIAMLALLVTPSLVTPSLVSAQHATSARAGIAPRVALVGRVDTMRADSIAPSHGSRAHNAVAGAIIGVVTGGVVGVLYAQHDRNTCTGDLCALAGLDVPIIAAMGLVAGTLIGALWPTR